MPYLDVDGVRLFYTDDGHGTRPVLLIHGWGCDSNDWAWQIPAFAADHRVIACDLRGHGRTQVVDSGYSPRHYADDLVRLAKHLDLESMTVIGHSMGALIASVLAVENPGLVRGGVMVDPSYGVLLSEMAEREHLLTEVAGPGGLEAAAAALASWWGASASLGLVTWQQRRLLAMPKHVLVESLSELFTAPGELCSRSRSEPYIQGRRCPVLVIRTEAEPEAWERGLLAGDPRSESALWAECGHWPQLECPEEFNSVVLEWMARLDDADTVRDLALR